MENCMHQPWMGARGAKQWSERVWFCAGHERLMQNGWRGGMQHATGESENAGFAWLVRQRLSSATA